MIPVNILICRGLWGRNVLELSPFPRDIYIYIYTLGSGCGRVVKGAGRKAKRMVQQCINGVSSNSVEGRTKIWQLNNLILTLFGLIFRHIYIYIQKLVNKEQDGFFTTSLFTNFFYMYQHTDFIWLFNIYIHSDKS